MKYHVPVLLKESVNNIITKLDGIYVDATLGGGGHFRELSNLLDENAILIGIDADQDAIRYVKKEIVPHIKQKKYYLVNSNYIYLQPALIELGITKIDGILFDLGVSSFQLDQDEKGFSYRGNAKIKLSFSDEDSSKAIDFLNKSSVESIANILKKYGEIKNSWRIAHLIGKYRVNHKIEYTGQLADIVSNNVKTRNINKLLSKIFQAIRIYVNNELENLKIALDKAINMLNVKGRIAVISYHSLEDRIVKHVFNTGFNPCTCPPEFPICVCGKKPYLRKIKKFFPYKPTDDEINNNIRSRSAKLRIVEKI